MVARRFSLRTAVPFLAAASVFCVALAARLVPLLRGGGLRGYGSYDDSVYFAASLGWLHGRWPYRDFLLLQPPGIVAALAPFAGLAHWFGDAGGLAAARLAWMVLGGLTAAGLVLLLWRTSRLAAVVAGLVYAFLWPAAMVERVTDLEGPQNFLLVAALLLLRPFGPRRSGVRAQQVAALAAGVALGLAWSIKIWEIAPVLVLAGWLAYRRRFGELVRFLIGVVAALGVVWLPFALVARRPMWTMVIADQLGRPRHPGWAKRLIYSTGTTHLLDTHRFGIGLAFVLLVVATSLLLAWRRPGARVVVVLFLVLFGVLMESPPTYVHYGAFVAPPLAILVGVAAAELIGLAARLKPRLLRWLGGGIVAAGVLGLLAALGSAPATARVGDPMPPARFVAAVARIPGCISYDQPSQALTLGVVSRDLDRGCPFVVDLGAKSAWTHLRPAPTPKGFSRSEAVALSYLRSGTASLLYRYSSRQPGPHGRNIIGCWQVIAHAHQLQLVRPGPACVESP
jgi:hypothetical protein